MPGELPPNVKDALRGLHDAVREDFTRNRRVMSFGEYLALVFAEPTRQLRSATQYIVDCFDHYGTTKVSHPWGEFTRWKLFDLPWEEPPPKRLQALKAIAIKGRPISLFIASPFAEKTKCPLCRQSDNN